MKNAREAITKAALRLFASKGYAGCSIREICEAAGVTKPVLYYHFQNKEHLYQELMLDIFDNTRKNLLRLQRSDGTARERLQQFVFSEFNDTRKDSSGIRLVFRMMFTPEEGYPYFNFVTEYLQERKILADCIRGIEGNAAKKGDPESVATALMGMMLMLILEYLFTGKRTLSKKKAEEIMELFLPASKNIPSGKKRGLKR